jgi:hypothetical protein
VEDAMGEYHLVGDPIDVDNRPPVFELCLADHLNDISLKTFDLDPDTPHLNPSDYFITSGDAVNKAKKLERDMWSLAHILRNNRPKKVKKSDALKLCVCPKCGSEPDDQCRSPSGRKTKALHSERYNELEKKREYIKQFAEYEKAVWSCARKSREVVKHLIEARSVDCFLETEWRNRALLVIPKNPRRNK